jgi:uncharacterized protein
MQIKTVIFDTNIWVSFFIKNQFDRLLQIEDNDHLTLLSSPTLVAELTDVLSRNKFHKYLNLSLREYIAFHENLTEMFVTTPIFDKSPDVKDNYLFDLAIQSGCNLLVTGDKKLLLVNPLEGVQIISLATFLAEI